MSEEENEKSSFTFRQMIVRLSEVIKSEDVKKMVFYCKDFIKAGQRDDIKDFLKLIVLLEERKKVGPNNLDFLKELLRNCTNDRRDVFDPISQYEDSSPVATDATPEQPPRQRDFSCPELNPPIDFLRQKLGRDWRFFARSLKVPDEDIDNLTDEYPRNVKEQIYRAIKIYLNRERERASKQDLIEACRQIRRIDLATRLERDDYS